MTLSPTDQAIYSLEVRKYFSVIGPTLLVYDYLLTFDLEYTHAWRKRPWSLVNTLYVLSRYMPFVGAWFLSLYRTFVPLPGVEECRLLLTVECYISLMGMGITEIIIVLRTWVVWERSYLVMAFLTLQGVVCGAVALYFQATWIDSLPLLDDIDGCASSTGEKREFITWALFIFADAVMLILMLVKLVSAPATAAQHDGHCPANGAEWGTLFLSFVHACDSLHSPLLHQ
ncbi:hypothetical protein HYDPIDRAFT_110782 [Hydnomerulius pinastri MD-312]|nr:hypothetical protein HYDPIDRAFT_110782 [Hydnomerulius pinastri MD-312]